MHPSPTTLWRVTLIFTLFVFLRGNKALAKSLIELCFNGCLINIDLQDVPHFDS